MLAVACVAIFSTAAAQDQIGLPLGSTPEAIEIEDLEGNAVDLGQYIGGGKPVVLVYGEGALTFLKT